MAAIGLDPVELIAGGLPRRQRRLVEAWAELPQEKLLTDWQRLQEGQVPLPIAPLERTLMNSRINSVQLLSAILRGPVLASRTVGC